MYRVYKSSRSRIKISQRIPRWGVGIGRVTSILIDPGLSTLLGLFQIQSRSIECVLEPGPCQLCNAHSTSSLENQYKLFSLILMSSKPIALHPLMFCN